MESLKPFLEKLISLKTLASQVESFAARCLPDFVYLPSDTRDATFSEGDLASFFGSDAPEIHAALKLRDGPHIPHFFTKWSRGQLLSHLGTREKWFESVSKAQEVEELNMRLHTLRNHMFRTMKSIDSEDFRIVRGFVSSKYADIPDVEIMKSIVELMPDGYAVRAYSGKTDRAFYAYCLTAEKISIPGTRLEAFPGVVLINSEVGYTSLWVIPMVYFVGHNAPVIVKRQVALRKVHRGEVEDLTREFQTAIASIKDQWGGLEERLRGLSQIHYLSEDEAVHAMSGLLLSAKAAQSFIQRAERSYRAAAHTFHTAVTVYEAILATVRGDSDNQDEAYISAELAGAVLVSLTK